MYKCNDCGEIFYEPAEYQENVGEFWGAPAYQTFTECPFCHSDDYEEIKEDQEQ